MSNSPSAKPGAVDFTTHYAAIAGVADRVAEKALRCMAAHRTASVLEIGCGTGEVSIAVAAARVDLRVIGIDISAVNIAAAQETARSRKLADRLTFVAADFLSWKGGHTDFMLAHSVLHLIEADTGELVAQLASTVGSDGTLMFTMPRSCIRNSALYVARRLWRLIPHGLSDAVALRVARWMYPSIDLGPLRDRLAYLRSIPPRIDDEDFRRRLQRAGFDLVERTIWPVSSIAQPSHSCSVWRRTG